MKESDEILNALGNLKEAIKNLNEKTDRLWDEIRNKNVSPEALAAMNETELSKLYKKSRQTIRRWKESGKLDKYNRISIEFES